VWLEPHWVTGFAGYIFEDVTFDWYSLNGILVSLGGAVLLVMALRGIGILKKDKRR